MMRLDEAQGDFIGQTRELADFQRLFALSIQTKLFTICGTEG